MAETTRRRTPAAAPPAFEWRHPWGPGVSAEGYYRGQHLVSVGIRPDDGGGGWWGVCYRATAPGAGGWVMRRSFPTCAAAVAYVEPRLADVLRLVGAADGPGDR
jgi:hypothetical protein